MRCRGAAALLHTRPQLHTWDTFWFDGHQAICCDAPPDACFKLQEIDG